MRTLPSVLAVALLLGACSTGFLSRGGGPEVVSAYRGSHLQVACYFPCDDLGFEALQAAEEAWKTVAELLEVDPVSRVGGRPAVHLYGSEADYQAVERWIAGGRFRHAGGFSSRSDREAHLPIRTDLPAGLDERVGLPMVYARNVAHEAAHLASYDLANGAYWPLWLAEGMAGWVERRVGGSAAAGPIWESNPWAATQLWRVQRMLEQGTLPTVEEIMTGEPLRLTAGDAYAVWTELFQFLLEGPYAAEARELVQSLASRRISETRAWPEVAREVRAAFPPGTLEEMDRDFRMELAQLRPGWVEVFRGIQDLPGEPGSWVQHSLTDLPVGALAWRSGDPGPPDGFRLEGTVEPLAPDGWEVRIPLSRSGADLLMVALDAEGEVRLLELAYEDPGDLTELDRARLADSSPLEGPIHFSLRFHPGTVWLHVGADPTDRIANGAFDEGTGIRFEVEPGEPDGLWGIGVAPGTAAIWRSLRLAPPEILP